MNYLIDEAVFVGKGANTVISLLHHYLSQHSLGECHLHLHADNCVGQNKNNFVARVSSCTNVLTIIVFLVLCLECYVWEI